MVKTTKGGKTMNPTDAYRKELRKKKLKRNKKERKKVREVGILKKDPDTLKDQIQKLVSISVKVSLSILGAEIDQMSPPELMKQFEAALNAKPELECFVKIFPGVSHGWTVRYKDDNAEEVKCAQEADKDLLDWFAKYLK